MRALVLSGGGAKGAYQVGVLRRWMSEQGRDYEILCGVSVGALNVAALSMVPLGSPALAFDRLAAFWRGLDTPKVWRRRVLGYLSAFTAESIYDSSPLQRTVRAELDVAAIARSGRKVRVGAVALDDGEYRSAAGDDPAFAEWVLASSAFPVFFQPISIAGKTWSDGGLRNVTPLGEAIALGATEIDVVMCSNPDAPSPWRPRGRLAFETALRAIDLMADEIVRTDIQVAEARNAVGAVDALRGGGKFGVRYRRVVIRAIKPSASLAADPLDFAPAGLERMMRAGYEDASRETPIG